MGADQIPGGEADPLILRLIVFVAGAVLMALELAGSRVLAPYFGNAIFVWGSLIGMVLGAMGLGYYFGGRLADRLPRQGVLAALLLLAGAWTFLLPRIGEPVNGWVLAQGYGLRTGPLVASFLLFAGPSLLMAMVTPFAIRLAARSMERLGSLAGELSGLSTLGSIAGTLLTAFYLVPAFGVTRILTLLGLTLVLAALVLNLAALRTERLPAGIGTAAALLLLLAAGLGVGSPLPAADGPAATAGDGIIFERDTLYHHIAVMDEGGSRYLRFDNSWQSGMYLDDPVKARFAYTDYFLLTYAFNPGPERALLVGLGGGSIPKRFLAVDPEIRMDVIELDPVVVDVARRYFALPDDSRLQIYTGDGRKYLQDTDETYDLIMLDAYYADAIPFHLTTEEFLLDLRDRLAPGGLVAANVIGALAGPRSELFRSFYKTYAGVFPDLYVFPVGGRAPEDYQNILLVGLTEPRYLSSSELTARLRSLPEPLASETVLRRYAAGLYGEGVETADVPTLTDDYAPVDRLLYLYQR